MKGKFDWSTERDVAELLAKAKEVSGNQKLHVEVRLSCANAEDNVYVYEDGERLLSNIDGDCF